ncbi:helix-hairpin-helix domain-containing protein [Arthrobacter sp. CAU 1506]|uniref:ComEA family DNA-binding protein n=1 Tax=Arthrobacter sp. CAU 1506 TaxID=2560052 RepID=UPI0010AD84ED|nr:helix-hairpin-helix domain-containing protein [Arthrobacter sp. CAU 1506]TJY72494.1 helix-hairpin-helix domain-containing protein [Arthrobacter sp. CAU 1506]
MAPAQPTLGWNIRQSWWLLVPVGTFGFLGGAALLVVGSRAKRPLWWILGLVHVTLSGVALALLDGVGVQEEIATWLLLTCWLAGSSFAVAINPEYLRFKWNRDRVAAQPSRTTGRTTRARSGSQLNTRRQPQDRASRADGKPRAGSRSSAKARGTQTSGKSRAARRGSATPAGTGTAAGSPPSMHSGPAGVASSAGAATAAEAGNTHAVDVNTASASELEALPGFSRTLAEKAVEARGKRGGFSSEQDFAAALDLPPHIFQRMRGRIVCGRTPQAPPSFGRIVDY